MCCALVEVWRGTDSSATACRAECVNLKRAHQDGPNGTHRKGAPTGAHRAEFALPPSQDGMRRELFLRISSSIFDQGVKARGHGAIRKGGPFYSLLKLSVSVPLFHVSMPWLKVCSMGRFRNSITHSR
jgi:hypothetical protein